MSQLFVPFECADCGGLRESTLRGYRCVKCGDVLPGQDIELEHGEVVVTLAVAGYTHREDCADCKSGATSAHDYVSESDLLDYDTAEAAGFDGTGRDGDPRFPYRKGDL